MWGCVKRAISYHLHPAWHMTKTMQTMWTSVIRLPTTANITAPLVAGGGGLGSVRKTITAGPLLSASFFSPMPLVQLHQACKRYMQTLSPISISILPAESIDDDNTDTDTFAKLRQQKIIGDTLLILFAAVTCTRNFIPWHFLMIKSITPTAGCNSITYRQSKFPLRCLIHVSRPWLP